MALVREVNKTLIGVVKQLESMRNTYRSLHKYEIPVGNPIEKELERVTKHLAKINFSKLVKLSGKGINETSNDSDEAYKNIPIGQSKNRSSVNREVFGGNTRSRCARMDNKMENNYEV